METKQEYSQFQEAYNWYNKILFKNQLPPCLITLQQRIRSASGYFVCNKFEHRTKSNHSSLDEISLNPDQFHKNSDKEILSTLVHEMVHLWQHHFGKPGRRGYHNLEFSKKMIEVGLITSDTGKENGMKTGERMSHYIISKGVFDIATDKLIKKGFRINWQSYPIKRVPDKNKVTFSCPKCGQNAWAKFNALLKCGRCDIIMKSKS